ncbi:hypothetical protein MRX96_001065 [Rhipicephalus microplus]
MDDDDARRPAATGQSEADDVVGDIADGSGNVTFSADAGGNIFDGATRVSALVAATPHRATKKPRCKEHALRTRRGVRTPERRKPTMEETPPTGPGRPRSP